MKKKAKQQEQSMVSILIQKTKCHMRAETILHIDSKPHLYFRTKGQINPNRFIADPQTVKCKDNSNVKNHHSLIA